MKRTLTLLGVLFLVSPVLFAATAPAASSPAVPTLAAPGETPLFLSTCQISKDCYCGGSVITISCTGNVSCTQQAASITCDGHRYSCLTIDCNPQGPGGD